MSTTTPNMGLVKPDLNDDIKLSTIPALAQNFQTIDDKFGNLSKTLRNLGCKGDGVTDDTQNIINAIATVNSNLNIKTLIVDGDFLVDLTQATANTLMSITRDNLTIMGGGRIIAKAASYNAGVANGSSKYYYGISITGNNVTVQDITFDGNNQFTQYGFSTTQPNVWMIGVSMYGGSLTDLRKNNKVLNCRYINGSGWAFKGTYQKEGLIQDCYAEHSQGIGFDGSTDCTVDNCHSYTSHDAHFATWNSLNAIISNCIADTNTNGSGCDISGSQYVLVEGCQFKNNQNQGILVTQDPNTGKQPQYVNIVKNILANNRQYAITEGAEIFISKLFDASTFTSGRIDGKYIHIADNIIMPNATNAITCGANSYEVTIQNNTFLSYPSGTPTRAIMIYGASVWVGKNKDYIGNNRVITGGQVYIEDYDTANNWDFSAASAGFTLSTEYQNNFSKIIYNLNNLSANKFNLEKRFGDEYFSADFVAGTSNVNVLEVDFNTGGYSDVVLEIVACSTGNHGVVGMRYYMYGYTTSISDFAAADTLFTKGTNPPTITRTISTNKATFAISNVASLETTVTARLYGVRGVTMKSLLT